ncbi:hypothetical protein C3V37_04720 [Peptostreptococcaceae bacterium oral taxon 929]|nr:hypothetical protein C3V37_04720 [Peptostreptococcaceae bacterium oral taxon 929]
MNWNKAKSILLVCFLIIDAVLLSMYMKKNKDGGSLSISKDDAIEILKAQEININEKELKKGGEYKGYILKYYDFDLDKINKNFFNGEAELDDRYDLKLLTKDEKSVSLSQGTLFSYMDASEEEKYPDMSMDKAIELANDFMREKELMIRGMVFDGAYLDEDSYQVHFAVKHDDIYLENSFINFTIDKRGVRRVDAMCLEYINTEDELFTLADVKDKILSIIDKPEVKGKTIDKVDMCYYLDQVTLDQASELKITRLRAVPHWRITFSDGYKMIL